MSKIILFFMIITSLFSSNIIKPDLQLEADAAVRDIVNDKEKLYVSTIGGIVNIFDLKTYKKIKTIELPKIKDFMGDSVKAKVYSVDILNSKLLILSQAEHGYRTVYLYEKNKLRQIISIEKKLSIAKAKFIDSNTIVLALLSNDIISYDIQKEKQNWTAQASQSKFSNFVLNKDKTQVVVCDESGNLHILDINDGKTLKTLSGENLDNIFQVDYKNNIIATAGKDRRTVIYDMKFNSAYYKTAKFFIYSVGLSPSGKIAGYASDENNNVTLFKTATKSKIGVFGGNAMTITNILFLNENDFFISSDNKIINFYRLK